MSKKIKVMQIIPSLVVGGAEIMVENLTTELINNGYDVCVISLYNDHTPITERLEKRKIPIFYLGKKRGLDIQLIVRLYRLLKIEKPDVIHSHLYSMSYAIPAAIFAHIPVKIHTIHSIANKEVSRVRRKINRIFFKYLKVVPVSISPVVKKSVVDEYNLKEDQIPMIYNGIDLKKCIPKQKYAINSPSISITHIGTFKEAKNHLGMIESFKIVHDIAPNTELYLVGEGYLESLIKEKIKELDLGKSVKFLGLKSNVFPVLNKSDIFVLPSLWEGMPISLIEAMGTGLPIVATEVGGIPDMIENEVSGLLVNVESKQIAAAILKLINDEKIRRNFGETAKIAANMFSAQNMAIQYESLYKNKI